MAGNLSKSDDGEIYINGNTDGTLIGNVGDRLKVDAMITDEHDTVFDRLKVSASNVLLSTSFRTGEDTSLWDKKLTTGGTLTFDFNIASAKLNTTSTIGSETIIQTYRYMKYLPGRGQSMLFSGNFMSATAGVRKRYGYFDELDGLFFEHNGTNLGVVVRSSTSGSAVDTRVAQSAWNGDKLDGTGESGLTFNITKQTLFFLEFAWLGSGIQVLGVYIGGERIVCHTFTASNLITTPWSQTASLPIRAEVTNVSGNTAGQLNVTCMSVIQEGEQEGLQSSNHYIVTSGTTEKTITSSTPIFSTRMRSTLTRNTIVPFALDLLMTSGTKVLFWEFIKNGTLTGASWANAGRTGEVDTSATSVSGGIVVASGFIQVSGSTTISPTILLENIDLFMGRKIDTTSEMLTLVASTSGGSAKLVYHIDIAEIVL